jgi:CBS domain-containing protein
MDPGEQTTGTRDEHYNLVSVLYHALHGAETCEMYALDAEAAADQRLAAFFREAQGMQAGLAERAKALLGILEVPPEPGLAPEAPVEGSITGGMPPGSGIPPEGMTGEVPPTGEIAPELDEEVVELVGERMSPEVVTVEPSMSIVDVARRMIEEKKGPLPVVEGERLVGMVTDRDIIARVVAEGRDPSSVTVDDIDTHELVTVGRDEDTEIAMRLMEEHQLDRILVVEGERLVGIISEADLRLDEGPL